jgi:hypothetical protein
MTRKLCSLALAAMLLGATAAAAAGAALPRGAYLDHALNRYRDRPGPVVGDPAHRAQVAARFLFPAEHRTLGTTSTGALRFLDRRSPSCRYTITFSVQIRLAAAAAADAHVADDLPIDAPPYLLEDGRRGSAAFRVIRLKTADGRTRLAAELARPVAPPRGQTAPAGQAFWAELVAGAVSQPGSECHSGTYREVLGPQLADAMATARFTRAFVT